MKRVTKSAKSPMNEVLSMKNPAAVALGKLKSKRKAASSRRNGKLGGRPKAERAKATLQLPIEELDAEIARSRARRLARRSPR